MKEIISIIIPTFNTESFLNECLDSVIAQTYKRFEVWIIDDGSTDGSSLICDQYAKRYDNIYVVHKRNCGVSSARNIGLDMAKGEYICFVDSDDYIKPDYLEVLYRYIEEYDCVSTGYIRFNDSSNSFEEHILPKIEVVDRETCIKLYTESSIFRQSFFGPWAKLYRASVIRKNRFDKELVSGEDIVFNLDFLALANKVIISDYVGYHVRVHRRSATNSSTFNYSPRAEHSYKLIDNKIDEARKRLGLPEQWISQNRAKSAPLRYYYEIINPFCQGSPYNKKQAIEVVKMINDDIPFINMVRSNSFKLLTHAGRIAYICAYIREKHIVSIIAKLCLKYMYDKN